MVVPAAYLIVLVDLIHTSITLIFCDDLTSVLDNDLVSIKAAVGAHTVAAICGLDNLHTNPVFATLASSVFEILESSVGTLLTAKGTISLVTLVEHDSVLAVISTTTSYGADTP